VKSALADFGDLVITLGVAAQSAAIGVATADRGIQKSNRIVDGVHPFI
jgi:hypothetical protein